MPQGATKPRYSPAQVERIRQALQAGESPAAIAQREGRSYAAIITLKHRLGVEAGTRESIGSLLGQRDRLAGKVSTQGARKHDLETGVRELEERHGALAATVKGLEQKEGALGRAIYQLEQIRAPQLIQGLRQQLIQAGWTPPGTVQPDTILWGEAAKAIWGALSRKG